MIAYIRLGTNDLERAASFYDALFSEIGANRTMTDERMLAWGMSAGQPSHTMFSVIKPYDENFVTVGNGVMVALDVRNPESVNRLYNKALQLGAQAEGEPQDRGSSMGFYGGYFRDLDGNKLVAYCLGWKP